MLIELLRTGSAARPDRPALVSADRQITYAEALARSEALARGLHREGIDRFGCQLRDAADVLTLLCGSSAVGSEGCVYPPHLDRAAVGELAAAFDHHVVVTDHEGDLDTTRALPIHGLRSDIGDLPLAPVRAPTMILTTGTTGRPKGARHDWARLVGSIGRRQGGSDERWLLAYNLNQFAGIQVLLHVLRIGATLVVPPSGQPRDAVASMRELGVTHASATPTFWRFATSHLGEEAEETVKSLPLRQITIGGEAVPEQLVIDLRRLFPRARVSQVYAATEFGSSVSVRDGRNGLPVAVLDRDEKADVRLRIVDGQLHARSKVGMLGYYGEDDTDDGWRATGDLVEVRGDRIHFVGRASETINVGGVKVHPLPIEEAVGRTSGVQLAHAYGRPNPVSGQIVAVDVIAEPGTDGAALREAIRVTCEPLPPAAQPRLIRLVTELDIREQKISRRRHG